MNPTDDLLQAYADAPETLSAAERAQVEGFLAAGDDATVAAVRALPTPGAAPDWQALEARIFAATTRAPRARWPWLAAGALAVAAAAAVALWPRPAGHVPFAIAVDVRPPPPVVAAPDAPPPTDVPSDDQLAADDEASDLDGLGPIDDELIDLVIAYDDEDPGDDDLPALGATWTGWLDDFSDDELDRALAWLDTQEAG